MPPSFHVVSATAQQSLKKMWVFFMTALVLWVASVMLRYA
jgi:hypothetical protein